MSSEQDVYTALAEVFSDVFLRDDITLKPELTASDVDGWDSFKQIEIVMACEERFGIKFSPRELDSMESLGDLVRFILAKTS
jgi:acyl carrier protein